MLPENEFMEFYNEVQVVNYFKKNIVVDEQNHLFYIVYPPQFKFPIVADNEEELYSKFLDIIEVYQKIWNESNK